MKKPTLLILLLLYWLGAAQAAIPQVSDNHTTAITSDGSLWAWVDNNIGHLIDVTSVASPVQS